MSFIEIKKGKRRGAYSSGVSVGIRTLKKALGIAIVFRIDVLENMNLKIGDEVTVLRGEAEHRGILCLKKGPGFTVRKYAGRYQAAWINLRPWAGIANEKVRLKKVNFNTDNDQLTIEISRLLARPASPVSGDDHEKGSDRY